MKTPKVIITNTRTSTNTRDILFLDIDGVLNSHEFYINVKKGILHGDISKKLVERLNNFLLLHENIKIVLSSSWRALYNEENNYTNPYRNNHLSELVGDIIFNRIIGTTVWLDTKRGDEIQQWLDNNQWDNYVILDDDKDMLQSQLFNFVHVDRMVGLTDDDINSVGKILSLKKFYFS